MRNRQPDYRIHKHELGAFAFGGRRYVIHALPGCPRNATIEIFNGRLRCWACKRYLVDRAAQYVRERATSRDYTTERDGDVFIWKKVDYTKNRMREQVRP